MTVALTAGCRRQPPPPASSGPPVVPVSHPVQREITDYVEYTGRTDAVSSVGIRARVTGYLVREPFKEGEMVRGPVKLFGATLREGDLLFEIDPRPYRAQLDQAQSQVEVYQAQEKLAKANYARSKGTFDRGAGSKSDVDSDLASVEQATAQIAAAKATVKLYELNLSYTQVRAPISGQVSRYYYTLGNLVSQDSTLLTTVVSVDPMYAYFDLDERTLLRVRKAINEGKIKVPARGTALPVMMGLEGEPGTFPHTGTVDFVNNVVNPSTGTIALRGVFDNPLPKDGRRLLSPGMFVRIRLPIGQPHVALLVVDRALSTDQGQKYAFVVDGENKVQYRKVIIGSLQDDGLRVIEPYQPKSATNPQETGLKPDEWVVVGALPQLKPKMEVSPEPTAMPTPGTPASAPEAK
jgi:multidrug efflux system membrane fusion protein